MICHEAKTIFIHIPKTAGQAFEQVFFERFKMEPEAALMLSNSDPSKGPEQLAHLFAHEYVDCGHVSLDVFRSYFKFAVVRNPFDRLVSEFKFQNVDGLSFRDFLLRDFPPEGLSDRRRHIEPQWKFVYGMEGEGLVDWVIKFESLAEEAPTVFLRAFGEVHELPCVNASTDLSPARAFYDAELAEFVRSFYRDDFLRFNYSDLL